MGTAMWTEQDEGSQRSHLTHKPTGEGLADAEAGSTSYEGRVLKRVCQDDKRSKQMTRQFSSGRDREKREWSSTCGKFNV